MNKYDEAKEIKESINTEFVEELVRNYFYEYGYETASIDEALKDIEITVKDKTAIYDYESEPKEENGKLGKYNAILLCRKHNIRAYNNNTTYACFFKQLGVYPSNPDPRHLSENWYILLDDYINKKLHVLKIPANSLNGNTFKYRDDNGRIVLYLNQHFVDEHYQEGISTPFAQYKIATLEYWFFSTKKHPKWGVR